jgi:signal transduction histidine kinase
MPHARAQRRAAGKLSTRLLVAYAALVVITFLLMSVPVQVLLKRDYVSEAAAAFEAALARHSNDLIAAAEKDDRISLDLLCETLNADFQGRVSLLSVDGAIIADSISARCLARARPECIPAILSQRRRSLQQYTPLDDTVTVRLPVRLGSRGPATARLALPLNPVRAKLRQMSGLLIVTACGAMVLAIGISLFLAKRIARPVEQMTHVAERIAAGDFNCTPPEAGSDEIGRLAAALTHMQSSLAETVTQLADERNQAVAMVQHLTDGVIVVGQENTVVFANEAAGRLLDIGLPEPGSTLAAPPAVIEAIHRAREKGCEADAEIGDVRQGATVVRAEATPVPATHGQNARVIVVLRNMTEARRAENLGRELVANASHELRTPLAVIGSSADTLLHAGNASAQQREFLEIIARQAQRLEGLVGDTLKLSQLDSATPAEPRRTISMRDLVEDVLTTFAPAAAQRNVALSFEDRTDNTPCVDAYAATLTQGIANLVDNAIRYTPEQGSVRVELDTLPGCIRLAVHDTGPGIAPAEQGRIFERFVRGRNTAENGIEGSGMGLAIVRRVAELHNGTVELNSTPGKGSCFSLTLPATPTGA